MGGPRRLRNARAIPLMAMVKDALTANFLVDDKL
jgi:hypothetical protein